MTDLAGAQRVVSLAALPALVGQRLGVSRYREVRQEDVNLFADATGDAQWIHVDVERARSGPFGTTIAHGYLTLSLAPVLLWDVLHVEDAARVINYGANRVRFPTPVPVGARVRMAVDLAAVEPVPGGLQAVFALTFEVDGAAKPACIAEIVFLYYAD